MALFFSNLCSTPRQLALVPPPRRPVTALPKTGTTTTMTRTRTGAARDREVAEAVAEYEALLRAAMPKILRGTRGGKKEKKALAAKKKGVLDKYPQERGRFRRLFDAAYRRVYNAQSSTKAYKRVYDAPRTERRTSHGDRDKIRERQKHLQRQKILAEKLAIANRPPVEGEDAIIGPEQADDFAEALLDKKVAQLDETLTEDDVPADWTLRDLLLGRTVYIGYTRRPVDMEALQWIGRVTTAVPVFADDGTFTGEYKKLPEHLHGFPLLLWGPEAPDGHAHGDRITRKPGREVLKFKTLKVCSFFGQNAKLSARTVEAKLQELFHHLPPGHRCWKAVDRGAWQDEEADKGCDHKVYVDFSAAVPGLISEGVVEVNSMYM